MYIQNAFKVNENILIFANEKKKQTNKTKPEIFLSNKYKMNKRYKAEVTMCKLEILITLLNKNQL